MGDQLKGRAAIVTGAASGLGKAIAEALALEGVAVVVNDLDISEQEVIDKLMRGPAALKRMLKPEEVPALVVYLTTDVAQCTTGSAVPIDCGWTAR